MAAALRFVRTERGAGVACAGTAGDSFSSVIVLQAIVIVNFRSFCVHWKFSKCKFTHSTAGFFLIFLIFSPSLAASRSTLKRNVDGVFERERRVSRLLVSSSIFIIVVQRFFFPCFLQMNCESRKKSYSKIY